MLVRNQHRTRITVALITVALISVALIGHLVGVAESSADPGAEAPRGWTAHRLPVDDDLHWIVFADQKNGFITSHRSGIVLETRDGGGEWRVRTDLEDGYVEDLAAAPDGTLWICGEGRLARSDDKGATWSSVPDSGAFICGGLDVSSSRLRAFGWGAGRVAEIWTANDGGASWTVEHPELPARTCFTDALATPEPERWVGGGIGHVCHRSSATEPWRATALEARTVVRGFHFFDAETGIGVGHGGWIARTVDGGATWNQVEVPDESPSGGMLREVAFTDAKRGWIVGDASRPESEARAGLLLSSRDGGATWRHVPTPTALPSLRHVTVGAGRVWIVGAGGTLLSRPIDAEAP